MKNNLTDGERLVNNLRMVLGFIYVISVPIIAFLRVADGYEVLPWRIHIFNNLFFIYSVILFFYLRKKETLHPSFKYICVIFDMVIITASAWMGCTYLEISPPIPYLSIWALFYSLLILIGSFRYSVSCAIFSGFFAGFCYLIFVITNANVIDLPYYFDLADKKIDVNFPLYYEGFRVIGMILTGLITGLACRLQTTLFKKMIESEKVINEATSKTVEQTRIMAETIRKSTDGIFLSSKEIFSTANNQAASVQEIESTINENTDISLEIAEKTASVAAIASKMEDDVINGFSVLERNVNQLENIKTKNDSVISGIIALGNKITKIRDIVKTINTITDQTKVIAFNAALEAASAGERGKRFAVVASEVNRLSDDISALTNQIRSQVEEIQRSSSSLIISSEESAENITEGNNLIKELKDIFSEIRNGAEITANQAQTITASSQKQQQSSQQLNIAISDISKGLSSFLQSTMVATSSAGKLSDMIKELDDLLTINTKEVHKGDLQ